MTAAITMPSRRSTRVCVVLANVHLLTMAVATYVASYDIETILVSGPICAVTGLAAGLSAGLINRVVLSLACCAAPMIALTLFLLEAFVLNLGPGKAAFPFMLVFLINQAISLPVILLQLRQVINRTREERQQISLRALMVTTAIFAALFALARLLISHSDHGVVMVAALAMLGLTIGGQALFIYYALKPEPRSTTSPSAERR